MTKTIMQEELNVYSLPPLFLAALYCIFPLFSLLRNKKTPIHRIYFVLGLIVTCWQFPIFVAFNQANDIIALQWLKISYLGLLFFTPACYHFIVTFLNLKRIKQTVFFYAVSSFLSVMVVTGDHIVAGIEKVSWGVRAIPGDAYYFSLVIWVMPFALSVLSLLQEYKRTESPFNKKRIKYFLFIFPLVMFTVFDAVPKAWFNAYPFGFIPLAVFGLAAHYVIMRYRLLDIEVIIKKASLIVIGTAFACSIVFLSIHSFTHFFYAFAGTYWFVFPMCISFLVGTGLLKFIDFVRRIEGQELSSKYTYRSILKREAEKIYMANNTAELATCMVRNLSNWVRLDCVSVFIFDPQTNSYVLTKSLVRTPQVDKIKLPAALVHENPLVQMLIHSKKPVVRSELQYYLDNKVPFTQDTLLVGAILEMSFLASQITIPSFYEGNLLALINIGNKLNQKEILTTEDLELFAYLSDSIAKTLSDLMVNKEKARRMVASSNAIINTIEAKDQYTKGHTDRVAQYTVLIGDELSRDYRDTSYDANQLYWSAQLHDIGKVGVQENILYKSGPLNQEEWKIMKDHPTCGLTFVHPVHEWLGESVCAGISQHHENYDGSGYPFSMRGQDIHLFARIIRVADTFDAMTSARPYRKAFPKKEAIMELERCRGSYYDPYIVEIVKRLYLKGALGF